MLYAVLLAFAVIVVWEKFSDAEVRVAEEAGAAATLFRLSGGVDGTAGVELRERLSAYINDAIVADWPAMEHGRASPTTTHALNAIYTLVLTVNPSDRCGAVILSEILDQLNFVTQARRARLVVAAGIVPGIVWFVLFGGAVLTVGFTFFFATESLRAQTLMTGALTALIFSGMLIIVAIDHPFAGSVKVTPEALSRCSTISVQYPRSKEISARSGAAGSGNLPAVLCLAPGECPAARRVVARHGRPIEHRPAGHALVLHGIAGSGRPAYAGLRIAPALTGTGSKLRPIQQTVGGLGERRKVGCVQWSVAAAAKRVDLRQHRLRQADREQQEQREETVAKH